MDTKIEKNKPAVRLVHNVLTSGSYISDAGRQRIAERVKAYGDKHIPKQLQIAPKGKSRKQRRHPTQKIAQRVGHGERPD